LTDRPRYPFLPASRGKRFALEEGIGLEVFAVVVSEHPLPPYRTWREKRGKAPWSKNQATPPGIVLRDDGTVLEALSVDDSEVSRGKGRSVTGQDAVVALTNWLRQAPDVDAVAALGFAVLPRWKP